MKFRFSSVSPRNSLGQWAIAAFLHAPSRPQARLIWLPGCLGIWVTLLVLQLGWIQPWSVSLEQLWFRLRGPQPWDGRLVLVNIDQASLDQLGWFPWSRDRYRVLLEQLSMSDNTVALNMVFSEVAPEDEALALAMVNHGQVVLSQAWTPAGQSWEPTPLLAEAAVALGDITAFVPPPQLATAPVRLQQSARSNLALATLQAYGLSHDLRVLPPLDQPFGINWPGPVDQLPQYSFAQVWAGQVPPSIFADKIVLVGATAEGMDPLVTPFNVAGDASGIHFHAALLHTLLQNRALGSLSLASQGLLALALGPLLGAWLMGLSVSKQLLWTGGAVLVFVGAGALSLAWGNLMLPGAWPLVLVISTALGAMVLRHGWLEHSNAKLARQAMVDRVTEIKNRNYFDQQFQLLWQQTVRRGGELSLLLCDIDYFKAYNDQYGHPAGDRCLQAVAQTLEGGLVRRTDWVARYGGEEFAIVLPDTHLEGATLIAERLQDELRQRCLPHRGSRVASVVTISIGIASLAPSLAMAYQDLIDEADRALYLAKQQGRDCYVALRTPV